MNTLIEINQENSLKLYDKIKHFFLDGAKKTIEYDLDNNKYLLQPKNNHFNIDTKCKKKLIAHLKSKFSDNRILVEAAIKNTNQNTKQITKKDNTINILREGVTVQDVDNYLKKDKRMDNLKHMANHLINLIGDKINNENKEKLINYIKSIVEIDTINIVLNFLSSNYIFGNIITHKSLIDKIKLNGKMINYVI